MTFYTLEEEETVLSDVKSLYDVIIDKKRMSCNPKEPFVHRLVAVGEVWSPNVGPLTIWQSYSSYLFRCVLASLYEGLYLRPFVANAFSFIKENVNSVRGRSEKDLGQ